MVATLQFKSGYCVRIPFVKDGHALTDIALTLKLVSGTLIKIPTVFLDLKKSTIQ